MSWLVIKDEISSSKTLIKKVAGPETQHTSSSIGGRSRIPQHPQLFAHRPAVCEIMRSKPRQLLLCFSETAVPCCFKKDRVAHDKVTIDDFRDCHCTFQTVWFLHGNVLLLVFQHMILNFCSDSLIAAGKASKATASGWLVLILTLPELLQRLHVYSSSTYLRLNPVVPCNVHARSRLMWPCLQTCSSGSSIIPVATTVPSAGHPTSRAAPHDALNIIK